MSIETSVIVFLRIFAPLILLKAYLGIVLGAPSPYPLTVNKTTGTEVNTVPRILTRPNGTREEDVLINEDTVASFTNSDIIFPDSYELLYKPSSSSSLSIETRLNAPPKCANGLSFCEEIDTYPFKKVKNILDQNNDNHNEFFGVDEAPPEITNRIGESEETFICNSIRTTIFPTVGETKDNKWKYIVNQGKDDRYVQGVLVEMCIKSDTSCNLLGDPPVGYTATCKQKYAFRRLLSISDAGQKEPDTFRMPSACCCSFKKDISFITEFGRDATSTRRRRRR